MTGLRFSPNETFRLNLNLSWTSSESSIAQLDLSADDYVETHASMAYDFSQSHLYSDLEMTRVDAEADARYLVKPGIWISLRYRWADLDDEAPYLLDLTGSTSRATAAIGWSF